METTTTIIAVIFVVFGVLQIILFFKLWEMTNDVKRISNKIAPQNEIFTDKAEPAEFEDDDTNTSTTDTWKCPQCNSINSRRSLGESTCVTCGYTLYR